MKHNNVKIPYLLCCYSALLYMLHFPALLFQNYGRHQTYVQSWSRTGLTERWASSNNMMLPRQAQIDHWIVAGSSFSLQVENPPAMSVTAVKPWKIWPQCWIAMNCKRPSDNLWDGHASLQQSRVRSPPSETSCRFGSPGKEQQARLISTES